jgi:hypothetical protein
MTAQAPYTSLPALLERVGRVRCRHRLSRSPMYPTCPRCDRASPAGRAGGEGGDQILADVHGYM